MRIAQYRVDPNVKCDEKFGYKQMDRFKLLPIAYTVASATSKIQIMIMCKTSAVVFKSRTRHVDGAARFVAADEKPGKLLDQREVSFG